jgi:hypothetical protein
MCPVKVTVVGCGGFVVMVCVTVLVVIEVRIALGVNKKYPPTTIDPTIKPMTKPPTSDHRKGGICFFDTISETISRSETEICEHHPK